MKITSETYGKFNTCALKIAVWIKIKFCAGVINWNSFTIKNFQRAYSKNLKKRWCQTILNWDIWENFRILKTTNKEPLRYLDLQRFYKGEIFAGYQQQLYNMVKAGKYNGIYLWFNLVFTGFCLLGVNNECSNEK